MSAPLPFMLEEPSILKLYTLLRSVSSSSFLRSTDVLGISIAPPSTMVGYVNPATKSASACPLMVVLGINLMSNSLNSISYLVNHPDTSGFCRTW